MGSKCTGIIFTITQIFSNDPKLSMRIFGSDLHTCKFIDSLNFLLCPLSKLPKTFELEDDVQKLYFPYFFNKSKNLNLKLRKLPHSRYYGMDSKSVQERDAFFKWYKSNRNQGFCLRKDLIEYCEVDVRILREACCKFRKLIIAKTKLDPFVVSSTIASLTMKVYQSMFLKGGTLVNTPENGKVL